MLTAKKIKDYQRKSARMMARAKMHLTPKEVKHIEVCDYELGEVDTIGTQIVIYCNTERCCAKELIMLPGQICPEHTHPPIGDYPGKEETFRCRWGTMYLYVPGKPAKKPKAKVPAARKQHFKVWHEVILKPGDQYTLQPMTPHWFQAGPRGCITSEFSTRSYDKQDIFTDPDIMRTSNIQ
jgi:D-lyxose ketol-isomerase